MLSSLSGAVAVRAVTNRYVPFVLASAFVFGLGGAANAGSWNGAYAGVHAGGAWGGVSVLDNVADGVTPGPFSYNVSGPFGGATVGFNLGGSNLVTGVEADLGFMGLTGAGVIPSSHPGQHQDITLQSGVYGDLTGRLGFAFGETLLYGKGGVAFYTGQAKQASTQPVYKPVGTNTFTGWTLGGGVEKHLSSTMSVKIEYLHFDFGTQQAYQENISDGDSPLGYHFNNWHTLKADSVKIGFNWALGVP